MVNRLRVDLAAGIPVFKLSAPTFNVDTATESQLLFDMAGGSYGGVFMQGIVPLASFSDSTTANFYGFVNYKVFEVSFGKTFAKLPKVICSVNDPLLSSGHFGPMYHPNTVAFYSSLTGCSVQTGVELFTNKIRLLMTRNYYSGSLFPYPASMSYLIFHG
jgi:hypothetical protein